MSKRWIAIISLLVIFVFLLGAEGGASAAAISEDVQPELGKKDPYPEAASEGGAAAPPSNQPVSVNASKLPQEDKAPGGGEPIPVPMGEPIDEIINEGDVSPDNKSPDEDPLDSSSRIPSSASSFLDSWEGPTRAQSGYIPPDPIVAVGPKHVVVNVNTLIRIYDRLGVQQSNTSALSWYNSVLPSGAFAFDPRILYDHHWGRFIMIWAATKTSTSEAWLLVSCSQTSDPTGGWWNYALDATVNGSTPTNNWPDYPRHGVSTDAITIAANMYEFGGDFQYTKVRILNKNQICNGSAAGWWDQWGLQNADATTAFTIVPDHQYDDIPDQLMINAASGSGDKITLWKILDPLSDWGGSGPTFGKETVTVNAYSVPPDGRQPGGVQALDNVGTRMLHAVVRDDVLYAVHTSPTNWGGVPRSAVRYYEIDNINGLSGPITVSFQVDYDSGAHDYYYPSVSVDSAGNSVVGFARSGSTAIGSDEYVSARYAGKPWDASIMDGSSNCAAGVNTYLRLDGIGRNRWGYYSGVEVAPDMSTFYIYNEYVGAQNEWYSRVCKVRYKIPAIADFDRSGVTDISVYRPANGRWYIEGQGNFKWGLSGDLPVPGDYDGDGTTDIAIFRPSNGKWYLMGSAPASWGTTGDIPLQADYTGDGSADKAVLRTSTKRWYIEGIGNMKWYFPGDIPVPCDYDGDGSAEIAIFRPSNNNWYVMGESPIGWGQSGDIPVPADYDGDGTCDIAVYRPSNGNWYVMGIGSITWGLPDDIPVPGDYDGDGDTEYAVLRPSNGKWYIKDVGTFSWYASGDFPLPVRDTNADGDAYE
jgi:hypothetical protein